MENIKTIKSKRNALFAGLSYLIIAITGFFALMYALPHIIVEGDMVATSININNNLFLFRIGIISILVMNIVSILLVIYLYRLLSNINKTMALSMLILMLFGACISALNEINHFAMIHISKLEGFSIGENQNLMKLFYDIYNHGTHIAVIFWGLWLFPLGALIFKLGTNISKVLGIMLVIAGLGYTMDSLLLFIYPHLKVPTLSDFTSTGEILLMIWLLVKSSTIEKLVLSKL